ncbi:SurA N-terminal domain-containing protein [Polaromonas sp. SM01]|uniref:SurA N-terminal domain-containing protein n=1 Tax=Polaromonas sp. SM01 TaxID=3085630 RepID=UPI0029823BFD|nr:SurA N-terminal domain-containing protein [Polaromonas sp. SM01]MDW5441982.1 SurA N-terminal domain-containing protein [Polaromonas sp. SM01]
MFDFIRKHTKITMGLLFLLIVPSFVLFGLDGYNRSQQNTAVVAKVNGQDIQQHEWDVAHQNEVTRLKASMPTLDAKLLDSPEARYGTLERLVRDRVLAAAAEKSNLVVPDQKLHRLYAEDPAIAAFRLPDGKFDRAGFLAQTGTTPEAYEAGLRADLSTRQVLQAVAGSGFAPKAVADMSLNAFFQKREAQIARFNTADYAAKVNPSEAELEQFYKDNQALFQAPEQASIEYAVLDMDAVKKGVTVNEQDLKTYYEQNASQLAGNEERRASHILIEAPASAPAADRQKAKEKAEQLLAAIKKAPDSFAELARKNSSDTGSAAAGGDLDFFSRKAMVKPFADAAFSMKKGDISDVVETEFGYHIIKLTDIKTPKQKSYEELKPTLEAELKQQLAQKKFAETAESFSNSVYEQSDSLRPIAERLKLDVKTASKLARSPVPGTTGVLANPKFLEALFSPDSVEKKRNTEALEVGPSQMVSGRITEYTAARTLPFAEVKARVRERLQQQRGAELARKDGAEKLAAWKANPASATLPAAVVVSREQAQQLPVAVLKAALSADTAALPALVGVDLGVQGYAVVKVLKVLPRDTPTAAIAQQEQSQYAQWWTSAEGLAYYNILKERFKADIKVARPAEQKSGT